jgi:murein DD-endopeptidase MepM/ murein hydrolase activator NlpD
MNRTKQKVVVAVLFIAVIFTPLLAMDIGESSGSTNTQGTYERSLVAVNFLTDYEYTDEVDKGVSALVALGSDGLSEEVRYVVRENGQIVSDELVAVMNIKDTKNQVVLMGTKEKPVYASGNYKNSYTADTYEGPIAEGSGNFICPVKGYVFASPFGPRNGRFHYGVDLTAPVGTTISASDGGTVVYAGSRNSYGLLVIIDHGNSYKTYYSHCNSISVKVGDTVTQGQSIATVGRTGNATGSHIHFEVRVNDKCMNPVNYVAL